MFIKGNKSRYDAIKHFEKAVHDAPAFPRVTKISPSPVEQVTWRARCTLKNDEVGHAPL
jgi:hypothetical protein